MYDHSERAECGKTQESEAGGPPYVKGLPGLHSEALYQKQNQGHVFYKITSHSTSNLGGIFLMSWLSLSHS